MPAGASVRSRWTAAGIVVAGLTGLVAADTVADRGAQAASPAGVGQAPGKGLTNEVFRNGEAGFVVTQIRYGLGNDANDGACPAGLSGGVRGLVASYAKTPEGARKPGETNDAYERRTAIAVNTAPNGQNICMNPEASSPDPGWRFASGPKAVSEGIDLDGQDSTLRGRPAPGTCAHDDFRGPNGERGIDNQHYRVIGCTAGYQKNGQANGWQIEMYTGSWGILVSLKGVDDLQNDNDVEVGIYANADPIQLSPGREALPYATYAVDQDARYRAKTRGRIVNGVLTIDPVDVRFHNVVNSMKDDRVLRDARLKMTFTADGGMEGWLAGYTPVEAMYDLGYGARHSKTAKGDLAPERLRVGTSVGRAGVLGHTCNGAYYALYQAADGNRDPATGRCTSISTQYRIRVAPAFVVDTQTESVNQKLAGTETHD